MNAKLFVPTLAALIIVATPLRAEEKPAGGKKKELTREEIAKLGGFEPAPDEPVQPAIVQVELIAVSVPKADALDLAERLRQPSTSEGAFRDLNAAIKAKKALLLGAPSVETRSGNRCVVESITELRYGTEFSPLDPGKAAPAKEAERVPDLAMRAPAAIGVTPTAFETRNTGLTLECEPVLSPDNKLVDLHFAAQHVLLLGWETNTVEEQGKVVGRTPQPRFHTNKVTSNVTAAIGQRVLAGVFEDPGDKERMEMFLIKAGVRPVKTK